MRLSLVKDLIPLRAQAIADVNTQAGNVRSRFITTIPGQEMIYLKKEQEAISYIAEDPAPTNLVNYPLLAAEIGVTASTAYELAQIWLNMASQWQAVAGMIETARLTAVYTIEVAQTESAIAAAMQQFGTAMGQVIQASA